MPGRAERGATSANLAKRIKIIASRIKIIATPHPRPQNRAYTSPRPITDTLSGVTARWGRCRVKEDDAKSFVRGRETRPSRDGDGDIDFRPGHACGAHIRSGTFRGRGGQSLPVHGINHRSGAHRAPYYILPYEAHVAPRPYRAFARQDTRSDKAGKACPERAMPHPTDGIRRVNGFPHPQAIRSAGAFRLLISTRLRAIRSGV
jgi:hypothetical protein